jgi:serine/threonine protein phosphatase 1
MTYALSDVHGCYGQYLKMLKKIGFTGADTLYFLGDAVDFGPEPMRLLRDMSVRPNVIPILGNHDDRAHEAFSNLLLKEFNEENLKAHFGGELDNFVDYIGEWLKIGGEPTMLAFGKLSPDEREGVVEYLSEFSLYETVTVNGKNYILTHAGLPDGAAPDNLDDFDVYDFVTAGTDYYKTYFDDFFLVTGHRPTCLIDDTRRGKVYRKHNHIAIDTGFAQEECEQMACVCLDTGEEFYVLRCDPQQVLY